MRRTIGVGLALGVAGWIGLGAAPQKPEGSDARPLAHMVFFALKERTPETRQKLVASCHKHLAGHEGTLYFSVGTIAEDVKEPVSDRDFDVALHLIFASKEAEAKYLKDPRHHRFVEENRDTWSRVRVFDSYIAPTPK